LRQPAVEPRGRTGRLREKPGRLVTSGRIPRAQRRPRHGLRVRELRLPEADRGPAGARRGARRVTGMPEELTHLRVVGPDQRPRPRRPGPAVLWILFYAALFAAALWYLRARSPLMHKSREGARAKNAATVGLSSARPPIPAPPRLVAPSRD